MAMEFNGIVKTRSIKEGGGGVAGRGTDSYKKATSGTVRIEEWGPGARTPG